MMTAIIINAGVIFLLYFPDLSSHWLLELIDHAFILLFLAEAITKLIALKPKIYFASNWNRFDFFIVVASLPSLLMQFLPIPDTSLLLILRLFRLVRLIRFIQFVPNMAKILRGLARAMKASLFVVLTLLFLNFMLAIFTCHFYAEVAPEYFANPLISSYTIFQMFTVEGWNEIPAVIAENMQKLEWSAQSVSLLTGLTRFYFVLIVLLGGIFGMSLANAVFVDEMTMDNNDVVEAKIDDLKQQIEELKELLLQQKK